VRSPVSIANSEGLPSRGSVTLRNESPDGRLLHLHARVTPAARSGSATEVPWEIGDLPPHQTRDIALPEVVRHALTNPDCEGIRLALYSGDSAGPVAVLFVPLRTASPALKTAPVAEPPQVGPEGDWCPSLFVRPPRLDLVAEGESIPTTEALVGVDWTAERVAVTRKIRWDDGSLLHRRELRRVGDRRILMREEVTVDHDLNAPIRLGTTLFVLPQYQRFGCAGWEGGEDYRAVALTLQRPTEFALAGAGLPTLGLQVDRPADVDIYLPGPGDTRHSGCTSALGEPERRTVVSLDVGQPGVRRPGDLAGPMPATVIGTGLYRWSVECALSPDVRGPGSPTLG